MRQRVLKTLLNFRVTYPHPRILTSIARAMATPIPPYLDDLQNDLRTLLAVSGKSRELSSRC